MRSSVCNRRFAPRPSLPEVIARSFARIHHRNLVNFGVLALVFCDEGGYEQLDRGDEIELQDVRQRLEDGSDRFVRLNRTRGATVELSHRFDERQRKILLDGGLINTLQPAQPSR
jgi:aconitate hydratase